MLITTTNDLPGYEVEEVLGEVFGLTVRSRNVGSQIGAGLKSLVGGELKGMTKALVDRVTGDAWSRGIHVAPHRGERGLRRLSHLAAGRSCAIPPFGSFVNNARR